MTVRQKVGLRKSNTGIRKRGKERREKLIKATYDLLCTNSIEEIAFIDIANSAKIPEGSAYHFFANRYDVFAALAKELSDKFIETHRQPIKKKYLKSWQTLADYLIERGAMVYADNPPAQQLLIGGKTPPEIKQVDRINDREVGKVMSEIFQQHFYLPDLPNTKDIFYYFIEITDVMFSLSVIEHSRITDEMLNEAKRVGRSYLASYLPEKLDRKI
jgi:AcrR family transcriptional regulator